MKRLLACLAAIGSLVASSASAQIIAGTQFAYGSPTSSVTINDGNPHAVFGLMVTAPVAGFAMLWPTTAAPSPGATTAPVCIAAQLTSTGSYAATLSLGMTNPTVVQSVTVAFSNATDCQHFTPYSTNTQITIFYQ